MNRTDLIMITLKAIRKRKDDLVRIRYSDDLSYVEKTERIEELQEDLRRAMEYLVEVSEEQYKGVA